MPFPLLLVVPFVMGAAAGSVVSYVYLKDPLHVFSEESSTEEVPETEASQAAAEDTSAGNSSGNSSANNTMS